ncbi:MAG: diguanylate cyclase [Acidobacteriia bacterium]|nr:diguanylate cyclase [Terriglobia bacterium]
MFTLSIVLAVFTAYSTLELAGPLTRKHRARRVWCLATVIFLVAGALAATRFARVPFFRLVPAHYSAVLSVILAAVIASWIALRAAKRENPDDGSAARFQTLAEAIPQIVWIADSNGRTSFINKRWYEMTGTHESDALGHGWTESVHPDDRTPCKEKWEKCMRSGETFEIEYRLHDATHGYRWYLDRAVPLRDDQGIILQWFGTCTDIEEQKHYQQILEQQIKERTEELAETNTRLQQEMWEKDLARRTLDEHNEEMMQAQEERSHRATLLAKMGELLQSCHTREEVFTAALGFAPKIFPSRRGAVALFNPSHNLVEVAGQWHDCHLPVTSFEPESCWALRAGHPHLVCVGDSTARCGHAAGVECAYLCVPILAQGEALGILHIQATDQDPNLGEAEMSFKTTFAAQVGLSVANIRLREALRAQSTKDPLTGLYNRRYLQETLDREIRRAIRSEQALGILMLDLDHFKNFNDTYGHDAGDAVLRETGSFLVRSIRAEDFVCRYGGEEFVIILPTADLRAAEARAQRIRAKLRDLVIMHDGRSLGLIAASIGVAALPNHGMNERDLIQAADAALYRAKREGRDRVAVADVSISVDVQANPLGTVASKTEGGL